MKRFKNSHWMLAVALAGVLAGCATATQQARKSVCPECKLEEKLVESPYWGGESITVEMTSVVEHSCPGCQGYFKTLLKEGKFKHKVLDLHLDLYHMPVQPSRMIF